jgi:hypothetical protein
MYNNVLVLSKLYSETIQNCASNDYDRISKTKKQLINKYKLPGTVHRIVTERGKEFDDLYDYWVLNLHKGDLNVPFMVQYKNEIYINVFKEFLEIIGKQLQEKKIFVLLSDSERYVLNTNISDDMAYFVGKLLAVLIINDLYLSFNISLVYFGHLLFRKDNILADKMFLYFILDLDTKLIQSANDISTEEEQYSIDDIVKSVVAEKYALDKQYFNQFIKGFFISQQDINKISIYDMDKMMTMIELSDRAYKTHIFDKLDLVYENNGDRQKLDNDDSKAMLYAHLEDLFLTDNDMSFKQMFRQFNINENPMMEKYQYKKDFCRAVLKFWTGVAGITGTPGINTSFIYTVVISDKAQNISSSICSNTIVFPVYANSKIKTKQEIYNAFMSIFCK